MSDSPGYFISAPWRSSGKTIFSIGLARAAKRRQLPIQPFKKGPDFIDPLWLSAASGAGCYNLDPYIQHDDWVNTFSENTKPGSLGLIEGTMGLHDGLQTDGSDSNASVAKVLNIPVILVVDCRGMHRTVAALVKGIQQFDPQVQFAGVVLNRVRSKRHADKIHVALKRYCDIPLLGTIPETESLAIVEKQLGLTPVAEHAAATRLIDQAADIVTECCDLDVLFSHFSASDLAIDTSQTPCIEHHLKIGIARDQAFHFYYQDDLDAFSELAVELIELSPVSDSFPADLDGLIIGGGFPERHAEALAANRSFINGLHDSIENGLPVHAECAGLMYLCKRLVLEEGSFDMVGVIDGEVSMGNKPQGRGYMKLHLRGSNTEIRAHEFHHSSIIFNSPQNYEFKVTRGHGVDGANDGILTKNVQASYAHFRQTRRYPWVEQFVRRIEKTARTNTEI